MNFVNGDQYDGIYENGVASGEGSYMFKDVKII
jgi:hypothetical protein